MTSQTNNEPICSDRVSTSVDEFVIEVQNLSSFAEFRSKSFTFISNRRSISPNRQATTEWGDVREHAVLMFPRLSQRAQVLLVIVVVIELVVVLVLLVVVILVVVVAILVEVVVTSVVVVVAAATAVILRVVIATVVMAPRRP